MDNKWDTECSSLLKGAGKGKKLLEVSSDTSETRSSCELLSCAFGGELFPLSVLRWKFC